MNHTKRASARDKYLVAAPLMTKVFESVKSMAHNVSDAPTDDSVELHILRSLLALIHWHRANSSERNLPCPTDFGYKLLNGKLVPLMMPKPAKPKNVKLVSFKCKKSRCARGCPCQRAGFTCIAACLCLGSRQRCARMEEVSSDDED